MPARPCSRSCWQRWKGSPVPRSYASARWVRWAGCCRTRRAGRTRTPKLCFGPLGALGGVLPHSSGGPKHSFGVRPGLPQSWPYQKFPLFSPSQLPTFMLQPLHRRFQQHVGRWPWRRVGLLAGISFGLALMLVVYLFGVSDHFFGRLFFAFLVFVWLLAVTFLAVVPFVTWATANWFGRSWAEAPMPAPRPRRAAASAGMPAARTVSSPAAPRRPQTR